MRVFQLKCYFFFKTVLFFLVKFYVITYINIILFELPVTPSVLLINLRDRIHSLFQKMFISPLTSWSTEGVIIVLLVGIKINALFYKMLDFSTAHYILLANGKKQLIVDGYTYCKHSCNKLGTIRYQCTSKKSKSCNAFAKVISDRIIKLRNDHTHPRQQYKLLSTGQYIKMN